MHQLTQFIVNHWQLWSILGVILVLIIFEEFKFNLYGITQLSTQQAIKLINHENAIIIDIRTKARFSEGHLLNALNFPHTELGQNLKKIQKYKNSPIMIIDNMGQESAKTGKLLRSNGFSKIYSLKGGFMVWQKEGLPVTKAT